MVNWVKLLDVQPWGPHLSDGEQNYGQKMAIFGHIWQYLAIDGSSCPIWVKHRLTGLNIVSHVWGDQLHPFGPIENGARGSQGGPTTAIFNHIWQYLAIGGPSGPINIFGLNIGWTRLNIVSHLWRDQLDPFGPIEKGHGGFRKAPRTPKWQFYGLYGHIWQWSGIWRSAPNTVVWDFSEKIIQNGVQGHVDL